MNDTQPSPAFPPMLADWVEKDRELRRLAEEVLPLEQGHLVQVNHLFRSCPRSWCSWAIAAPVPAPQSAISDQIRSRINIATMGLYIHSGRGSFAALPLLLSYD